MRILSFGLTSGSGFWRVRIPLGALARHGHQCIVSERKVNDEEAAWPDTILLKNVTDQWGLATVMAARELKGTKIVMDVDDNLEVGSAHPLKRHYAADDVVFTQQQTAKIADCVTTTTEYLAEKLKKLNSNVVVIPNCYEPSWFNVKPKPHDGPLRIGWAGGGTHEKDLEMLAPVIKTIHDRYGVQIVARGDTRVKKMWGDFVEYYPTVPIEYYPEALAAMSIDVGLCPLTDEEFNRCKSPIKAMEYALLGVPSVCSPTMYSNYPVLTIAQTPQDWIRELSRLIERPALRETRGKVLKWFFEENFNINNNWQLWEKALR